MTDATPAEPTLPTPAILTTIDAPSDKVEDLPLPTNGPYYVRANDGYFVHRTTPIARVFAKLDKNPVKLPNYGIRGYIWTDMPKIPEELLSTVYSFFTRVYKEKDTEAAVLLLLDKERNWDVFVPQQDVTRASVDYEYNPTDLPEGKLLVGTIHSHCDFSAFHSSTDTEDAGKHDGIHLTIGNVLADQPSIDVMAAFNGVKWDKGQVTLEDVTEATTFRKDAPFPEEWMRVIHVVQATPTNTHVPAALQPPGQTTITRVPTGAKTDRMWDWSDGDESDYLRNYYGQNRHVPWPQESDYAEDPIRAFDDMEFDLFVLQEIARNRGLKLKFKLTKPQFYAKQPPHPHARFDRGPAKPVKDSPQLPTP